MLLLLMLTLAPLIHRSAQQCLTVKDEIRKVNPAAHDALLQSELQFSAELLRTAASLRPADNLIVSPTSVYQASLLAYFISANQTERGLRNLLHLAQDYDKIDILGAYNLENYYQRLRAVKSRSYQLSSANRFYIAKDLKTHYCMKVLFAEELAPANFQENSKGVVKKINQWVAGVTRNVIKDFLSEDDIQSNTALVLVNAAYFKGKWKSPFSEGETYEGEFHLSNGTKVLTMMMTQEGKFKHKVDKKLGAEVLELPYVGDDISMLILLPVKPSPTAVQDLLRKLTGKDLQKLVESLNSKESAGPKRTVTIPKFTVESELDLQTILESMGVGDLFQSSADLSVLAPGVQMTAAVHKAKIQVDEKGTEAAAATSFISARVYIESFTADQPFVYTVYNKAANIPLFLGVFNHPEPTPT